VPAVTIEFDVYQEIDIDVYQEIPRAYRDSELDEFPCMSCVVINPTVSLSRVPSNDGTT